MLTRTCSVIVIMLSLGTALARAQDSHPHQGFWIGFGLGAGVSTEGDPQAGGDLYLRIGGTLNPHWLLGGEAVGWGRSENGASLGRGNTTFSLLFYPGSAGGFYAKAGVGMAYVNLSGEAFGLDISASEQGFGSTVGLGYDIRLGNNLFLVPAFDWLFQAFDSNTFGSTNSVFMVSLGLIWH